MYPLIIRRYADIDPNPEVAAGIDAVFFEASNTKSFADAAARRTFRERWLGRYLVHDARWFYVALVGPDCSIDDQDQYMSSPGTLDELSVTGYTPGHGEAGRISMTGVTGNQDFGNDEFEISANTFGWTLGAGATVAGVIVHLKGTSDDTDALIIRYMDVTDTATNGGRITVTPATWLKGTYS